VLDEMGVVGAYEVQFLLERIEGGRADVRDIHRMWLLLSLEGWVRNGRSVRVD
jgi:hypothetical protein